MIWYVCMPPVGMHVLVPPSPPIPPSPIGPFGTHIPVPVLHMKPCEHIALLVHTRPFGHGSLPVEGIKPSGHAQNPLTSIDGGGQLPGSFIGGVRHVPSLHRLPGQFAAS